MKLFFVSLALFLVYLSIIIAYSTRKPKEVINVHQWPKIMNEVPPLRSTPSSINDFGVSGDYTLSEIRVLPYPDALFYKVEMVADNGSGFLRYTEGGENLKQLLYKKQNGIFSRFYVVNKYNMMGVKVTAVTKYYTKSIQLNFVYV